MKQENIYNIPNTITLIRIILTFIIFYLILAKFSLIVIGIVFIIGMITDFLDGFIARNFNQRTEFGRKFDMIADRFLMLGTVFGIMIYNMVAGLFNRYELLLIFLVLSREIVSFPFAILSFFMGNFVPQARNIAKFTTFMQAVAFPMILFKWEIAIYFVVVTAIFGAVSGGTYIKDSLLSKCQNSTNQNKR